MDNQFSVNDKHTKLIFLHIYSGKNIGVNSIHRALSNYNENIPSREISSCIKWLLENEYIEISQRNNQNYLATAKGVADFRVYIKAVDNAFRILINEHDNIATKDVILDEMSKLNDRICNIHTQIISIMGILIAAFSIIGFNFTAIKTVIEKGQELSVWEYISAIGVVNLSVAITLYFLFYLVSKITNSRNKIFNPIVAVVAIIALVVMIFMPVIIENI